MNSSDASAAVAPIRVRRGRPPRTRAPAQADTRALLIRTGLAALTETGYSPMGLDAILRSAGVTKGSFYHYFDSKQAFGLALIDAYADYFAAKLERWFSDRSLAPLQRLLAFVDDAKAGMRRHGFRRGCLIGNLGQEMSALPEAFRARLIAVFEDWQTRTAHCLDAAVQAGQIRPQRPTQELAALFWIGWEGAVLRAKLEQRCDALDLFTAGFVPLLHPTLNPPNQGAS